MKVKDCMLLAAELLGIRAEVDANLSGSTSIGVTETEKLLHCFNLVENELALDYLPLLAEDELETDTGAVLFSEFAHSPVRIVKVLDGNGETLDFTLFPEFLKTAAGKIKVRYTYAPKTKEVDGESDFTLGVSERLIALGMVSEYSISVGLYEEASVWEKKYKDAIAAAYKTKGAKRIQSRRWV